VIAYIRHRWRAPGGYREFLIIALPLILSTATWSIQHFIDRVFLTWYSTETLAAALPAAMTQFIFVSLFLGVATYINTFVAQYIGANRPENVGPAIWQGAYLAIISLFFGLGLGTLAEPIFNLIGHETSIRNEEITYFRVLSYGIGPIILSASASCFYSGRGKTWTILGVNVFATLINVFLDYGLIFGKWGLPAWGIRGAAWATNISSLTSALIFFSLILRPRYREQYGTLRGWKLDIKLFKRLLRFGGPNGVNFMLDMLTFSSFILICGRLGMVELAATNIAFNINSLAFMPLIGASIAMITLVGQRLGSNRPEEAEYCIWTGFQITVIYMSIMALIYCLIPQIFLIPYSVGADDINFDAVSNIAIKLLRIVAVYCLFDAVYMAFTAALKGAGDTRYIMIMNVTMGWILMIIPSFIALTYFNASIYILWSFICVYIIVSSIVFYFRFRSGKWKSMRVIENAPLTTEETARIQEAKAGI
jgi:MATE family multidrug resistance protein